MTQQETIDLVCRIYDELAPPVEGAPPATESTRLFGGALDSVNVVTLIVEVEEQIAERCGASITIADDHAMSRQRSPFRTIGSLAEYVQDLMAESTRA
ncbi:MAG TPA: acyl carrier protein [Alloacidobacterium sp.]|nr:acyl carrier protein [Alloacidobacterium sp.]